MLERQWDFWKSPHRVNSDSGAEHGPQGNITKSRGYLYGRKELLSKPTTVPRLSVEDAAEITGLSKPTIRRHISLGKLKAYRAGRIIRIHEEDLAALFQEIRTA